MEIKFNCVRYLRISKQLVKECKNAKILKKKLKSTGKNDFYAVWGCVHCNKSKRGQCAKVSEISIFGKF